MMTEDEKYKRSLRRKRILFTFILISGLLAHLAGFLYLKVVSYPSTNETFKRPFVHFESTNQNLANQVVQERAMLFDSAPLFLPTRWNTAGVYKQPDLTEIQTPLFDLYTEQITLSEDTLSPESAYTALGEEELKSQLSEVEFSSLKHFGELDTSHAVTPRVVQFQMIDFYTGKIVYQGRLPDEIIDEIDVERPEYSEWILLVTIYGVSGEPYRIKGSAVGERDESIRKWLMLAPFIKAYQSGYFRIVIGS